MPWITVDCDILDHPKLVALPSDSARLGWLATMLEAKRQRQPGRFANERHYKHVIGKYARFLALYLAGGLLEREGEALVIHDWSQHQRDRTDTTNAERQRRHRERQAEARDVTQPVTPLRNDSHAHAGPVAVDVGVSVPVEEDDDEGTLRTRVARLGVLIRQLTRRDFRYREGSAIWQTMTDDLVAVGDEKLAAAYRAVVADATGPLDEAGVVYGAHKRLFQIPDAPRVSPAQRKQSEHDELLAKARRGELRTRPVPS
jgi:hypothetical protein